MSSESYLETRQEITSFTNDENFFENFQVVDEHKDSDEESFHLLSDDDDGNIVKEMSPAPETTSNEKIPHEASSETKSAETENNNQDAEKTDEKDADADANDEIAENMEEKDTDTIQNNEIPKKIDENSDKATEEEVNTIESEENDTQNDLAEPISNCDSNVQSDKKTDENFSEEPPQLIKEECSFEALNDSGASPPILTPETEDDILNKFNDLDNDAAMESDTIESAKEDILLEETSDKSSKESEGETKEESADKNTNLTKKNEETTDSNQEPEKTATEIVTNKVQNSENDLLDVSFVRDQAEDDADIAEASNIDKESEDSNTGNELDDAASRTSDRRSSSEDVLHTEIEVDNDTNANKEINDDNAAECDSNKENELNDTVSLKGVDKETDPMDVQDCQINSEDGDEHFLINQDSNSNGLQETSVAEESINDKESNEEASSNLKRLVEDVEEPTAKKLRLSEDVGNKSEIINIDTDQKDLKHLISLMQYMKNTHLKNLTRRDLEEFCLQKICEAILHKSDLGDLNHVLRVQEQTIESLRKEQRCLSKQVKDLEIVNKKLMAEVKSYTGQRPLVPVKITRSVGLQVRMMTIAMATETSKRLSRNGTPQNPPARNKSPRVPNTNSTPSPRQAIPNGRKTPCQSPILAQTLQTRQLPNSSLTPQKNSPTKIIASKPSLVQKSQDIPPKPAGSSFIDLTDDDDNKKTTARTSTTTCVIPQGIRINTTGKTNGSVLPVVSGNTPLMYVVQPNQKGSNAPSKAILVNFQTPNGVVGLNSNGVSVIPKSSTAQIQKSLVNGIKPLSIAKSPNKHPAALPNPLSQPNIPGAKMIPPKPHLSIRKTNKGIILQWRMPYDLGLYETIVSYQLYAYQETAAAPSPDMWKKIGDVKAMALPMACTLTQFAENNKYYFAVRPIDSYKRIGKFSNPEEISL